MKIMFDLEKAENLLTTFKRLTKKGKTTKEIAAVLGYKAIVTFNNHLIKASQITGRSIPPFGNSRKKMQKETQVVKIRRRGKGETFGVNIPQEPLARANFKVGDRLKISVQKGKVTLNLSE